MRSEVRGGAQLNGSDAPAAALCAMYLRLTSQRDERPVNWAGRLLATA